MGTSHLKLIWVRGFNQSMLKSQMLKHHIPEHPINLSDDSRRSYLPVSGPRVRRLTKELD